MFSLSHRIHVWYDIFTYIWLIFMDIPYMDAMGMMDGKKHIQTPSTVMNSE